MKSILTSLFVAVSLPTFLLAADDAASGQAEALGQANRNSGPANAHPDAQWFPKAGLGLFIHWGIAAVQAKGDLSWCMLANKFWDDATIQPNAYYASIKDWHPDPTGHPAIARLHGHCDLERRTPARKSHLAANRSGASVPI